MKRRLFAPLALAALLLSTQAATAAPRPPRHLTPRELEARREAQHRPAPRPQPEAYRYHRGELLPAHRVARLPQPPAPARPLHR